MAERTDPIRQEIDATRASMTDTLEQIEGQARRKVDDTVAQAKRAFDIRHHVEERPWLTLSAAVTAGFILGSMGGGKDHDYETRYGRPGEPMRYYAAEDHWSAEDRHSDRDRHDYDDRRQRSSLRSRMHVPSAVTHLAEPLREELTVIAAAAMRSAVTALRDSLRESIPQFEKEYRATQREHGENEERSVAVGASSQLHNRERPGSTPTGTSEEAFRTRQG